MFVFPCQGGTRFAACRRHPSELPGTQHVKSSHHPHPAACHQISDFQQQLQMAHHHTRERPPRGHSVTGRAQWAVGSDWPLSSRQALTEA